MRSNVSVPLFNNLGKIIRRLSFRQANRLIDSATVDPIDMQNLRKGVTLAKKPRERRTAVTLHELAILKHTSFVQGGLTRTETNPVIKPYPVRFPATGGIIP